MKYSIYSVGFISAENSYDFDDAFYICDVYEYKFGMYEYSIEVRNNKIYLHDESHFLHNDKKINPKPYCYGHIDFYSEIKTKVNKINLEIRKRKLVKI